MCIFLEVYYISQPSLSESIPLPNNRRFIHDIIQNTHQLHLAQRILEIIAPWNGSLVTDGICQLLPCKHRRQQHFHWNDNGIRMLVRNSLIGNEQDLKLAVKFKIDWGKFMIYFSSFWPRSVCVWFLFANDIISWCFSPCFQGVASPCGLFYCIWELPKWLVVVQRDHVKCRQDTDPVMNWQNIVSWLKNIRHCVAYVVSEIKLL